MYAITAAHKTLPIPSYAYVKNLQNGKEMVVRINDRGPFHDGRILDLSYAAAIKLGVAQNGTAPIELRAISLSTEQISSASILASKANEVDSSLYVQVGAYRQPDNAEKVRARLERAALVHTVEVAQFKKEYNTLYRVRIGPVANRQEAEAVSDSLRDLGIRESQIVSE
jgi:rare lipoprotein A